MAEELFNQGAEGNSVPEGTESATNNGESGVQGETGGEQGTPNGEQTNDNGGQGTGSEQVADITYSDFTVPDGFEAPNEDFLALTKTLGLNQESVQKVVDYYTGKFIPSIQQAYDESQKQAVEKRNAEWAAKSTKDIGKEGIDRARLAIKQFGGKDLTDFLNTSGLGNHPVLVKLFADIGEKMSESTLITGKSASEPPSRAEVLFGDMFK